MLLFLSGVIFKLPKDGPSSSTLPPKVDYTVRMHIENSMRTDRSRNTFWVKASYISPLKTQRYIRGFAYLQEGIERAIVEMQAGKEVKEPAVQVQAFPYPCFYKDEWVEIQLTSPHTYKSHIYMLSIWFMAQYYWNGIDIC